MNRITHGNRIMRVIRYIPILKFKKTDLGRDYL